LEKVGQLTIIIGVIYEHTPPPVVTDPSFFITFLSVAWVEIELNDFFPTSFSQESTLSHGI